MACGAPEASAIPPLVGTLVRLHLVIRQHLAALDQIALGKASRYRCRHRRGRWPGLRDLDAAAEMPRAPPLVVAEDLPRAGRRGRGRRGGLAPGSIHAPLRAVDTVFGAIDPALGPVDALLRPGRTAGCGLSPGRLLGR